MGVRCAPGQRAASPPWSPSADGRLSRGNLRHYSVLVQGCRLAATWSAGIPFVGQRGAPTRWLCAASGPPPFCDRGYLGPAPWRSGARRRLPVIQVESDVSCRRAARTSGRRRPDLFGRRSAGTWTFLVPLPSGLKPTWCRTCRGGPGTWRALLGRLELYRSVRRCRCSRRDTAAKKMRRLSRRLAAASRRTRVSADQLVSHMSKYLHFGQISRLHRPRAAQAAAGNPGYRRADRAPRAALITLLPPDYDVTRASRSGRADLAGTPATSGVPYSQDQWSSGDARPVLTAAMTEMKATGYMHTTCAVWGKRSSSGRRPLGGPTRSTSPQVLPRGGRELLRQRRPGFRAARRAAGPSAPSSARSAT